MENLFKNNRVRLAGTITKETVFSHTVFGQEFYRFFLGVPRISGYIDEIPVLVPEHLFDLKKLRIGEAVAVSGEFRSFNLCDKDRKHLILSVYAKNIEFLDDLQTGRDENNIQLYGHICQQPTYRITPLGRNISDVLVAVNRAYGKSDYIPCICWGKGAVYASSFTVGSCVQVYGRLQSRNYTKRSAADMEETHTAYEVSVHSIALNEFE